MKSCAGPFSETEQGKADALGGGVFKKRLHQNRERAIILAKGGSNWFYTFLYAKQDMSNINSQELAGFGELASTMPSWQKG